MFELKFTPIRHSLVRTELVMKLSHSLLFLMFFQQVASADVDNSDRYTLPPNKVYIESCKREALLLHPGQIEKQQMLHRHGDFSVQYEIQTHDGSEWIVLCDMRTGKIINEEKLVDDAVK